MSGVKIFQNVWHECRKSFYFKISLFCFRLLRRFDEVLFELFWIERDAYSRFFQCSNWNSKSILALGRTKLIHNHRDAHTRTFVLAPYSRTLRSEYEKYGVQRVSYPKSTDWSTGYGNFCQNGVRRVRGTKSTVLVKYGFWYGVRLIFGVRSTESTGYE